MISSLLKKAWRKTGTSERRKREMEHYDDECKPHTVTGVAPSMFIIDKIRGGKNYAVDDCISSMQSLVGQDCME